MKFDWSIIGHKKIVKFLQESIKREKIAHAYLFYGPENLGKKTMAKLFAQSLVCEKNKKSIRIPCGQCQNCQQFIKNIYFDVTWLKKEEDKKNISVEQIRGLREKIGLSGFTKDYKIIIIINAEEMTIEAANAFLKILEEPPEKNVIILLANNPKNIPETIISRCQLLKFSLVAKQEIKEFLEKKHNLSINKAEEIACLSLGHPGQAIKFVDDKEIFEECLDRQKKLIKIIEGNLAEKLKISSEVSKSNEIKKIIIGWKNLVRDLILLKTNNQQLIVNLSLEKELARISKNFSFEQLSKIEKELDNLNLYFRQNINLKLALDNFVINV